jgi:predicted SnoaL-like aldol condensation-catalyzing enzyme
MSHRAATRLPNSCADRARRARSRLPILNIIAERDIVMVMSQRPMKDAGGKPYITTWFDTYRVIDGKISEHWDPALKDPGMLKFDPNTMTK